MTFSLCQKPAENIDSTCTICNRHGASERVYRLEFVSNQDFTESEFFKWKEAVMLGGSLLPSTDDVQKKLKDIQSAHQFKFKDADIEKVCL